MSTTTLCSIEPPRVTLRQYVESILGEIPIPALPAIEIADGLAWAIAAFTPSATSGSVNFSTDSATGCNARILQCSADRPAAANLVLACIRRKTGTSGSIVANTVPLTVNSVELGRLKIAAGAEVGSWFMLAAPAGAEDALWDLEGNPAVSFTATAADSDVEVTIIAAGPA